MAKTFEYPRCQVKRLQNKIYILFVVIALVFTGCGGQAVQAAEDPADPQRTIYVVPAITDLKILPTSSISSDYVSDEISITASPGEYEPASFVIQALDDIAALQVEAAEQRGHFCQ